MRIPSPQLPSTGASGLLANVIKAVSEFQKAVQLVLNGMSDGRVSAYASANTGPPAANSKTVYAAGDFIRNKSPSQAGAAGSMYVITGWICIAPGTPGTWIACRCLTGN